MSAQAWQTQAKAHMDQGAYGEAVNIYAQLWAQHPDVCNEWDGWNYARALRKLGRAREALDVCRQVRVRTPNFDRLNQVYGWSLYDVHMKGEDETLNKDHFFRAAHEIISVTTQGEYSPYTWVVFRVVDFIRKGSNPDYREILKWLDRLDPASLSSEEGKATAVDAKVKTFASDQEKWYTSRVRALLETQQYDACLAACTEGLRTVGRFHTVNDVWLRWYRAKALRALGQAGEALVDLKAVEARKRDAFVKQEIARAHAALGDVPGALAISAAAALERTSDLEYIWELFQDMAHHFIALGDRAQAQDHALLAYKIRLEKAWKMGEPLQMLLKELEIDLNQGGTPRELYKRLRPTWEALRPRITTACTGRIDKLHDNGKSGIIRTDDNQVYFFGMRSVVGKPNVLRVGMEVRFNKRDVVNNKTGQSEVHAVDVTL